MSVGLPLGIDVEIIDQQIFVNLEHVMALVDGAIEGVKHGITQGGSVDLTDNEEKIITAVEHVMASVWFGLMDRHASELVPDDVGELDS
jgi:hypothetical protein